MNIAKEHMLDTTEHRIIIARLPTAVTISGCSHHLNLFRWLQRLLHGIYYFSFLPQSVRHQRWTLEIETLFQHLQDDPCDGFNQTTGRLVNWILRQVLSKFPLPGKWRSNISMERFDETLLTCGWKADCFPKAFWFVTHPLVESFTKNENCSIRTSMAFNCCIMSVVFCCLLFPGILLCHDFEHSVFTWSSIIPSASLDTPFFPSPKHPEPNSC